MSDSKVRTTIQDVKKNGITGIETDPKGTKGFLVFNYPNLRHTMCVAMDKSDLFTFVIGDFAGDSHSFELNRERVTIIRDRLSDLLNEPTGEGVN